MVCFLLLSVFEVRLASLLLRCYLLSVALFAVLLCVWCIFDWVCLKTCANHPIAKGADDNRIHLHAERRVGWMFNAKARARHQNILLHLIFLVVGALWTPFKGYIVATMSFVNLSQCLCHYLDRSGSIWAVFWVSVIYDHVLPVFRKSWSILEVCVDFSITLDYSRLLSIMLDYSRLLSITSSIALD